MTVTQVRCEDTTIRGPVVALFKKHKTTDDDRLFVRKRTRKNLKVTMGWMPGYHHRNLRTHGEKNKQKNEKYQHDEMK